MNQSNLQGRQKYNHCERVFVGKGKAKRIAYVVDCYGIYLRKKGRMEWAGYEYTLVSDQESLKMTCEELQEKGFSFVKHEKEITKCC